ncbi:type I secretion system permease/ATPase [Polycladidibacter hongkongensis]|uniref:type I secretion system permease/ATPase n=1 Tax=Polycladidibacter hongkongensis TaxID=1647556 RepID=UPI0009EBDD5E|nr:type I secretion system permease/ATPase [Pseudovibrio hongkongensis]
MPTPQKSTSSSAGGSDAAPADAQSSDAPADPLVEALRYIARHFGNFASASVILAGLPVASGPLPIKLVGRAAKNCALQAVILKKPLKEIPRIALPALLILENGGLRLLTQLDETASIATLVDPLVPEQPEKMSLQALQQLYIGSGVFFNSIGTASDSFSASGAQDQGHWFWSVVGSFWKDYLHIALAALLINLLALASPFFVMNVYDRVLPNYALPTLWALAAGVMLALAFDGIFKAARSNIINITGKQADLELASRIFSRALALNMDQRPGSTGQFANQIKEFESVREFFTSSSLVALIDLLFIGIFIGALFFVVGPIAWIPLAAVPVVIAINLLVQAPLAGSVASATRESAARHSVLVESVAHMDTLRALNAEAQMQTKWERSVAASASALLRGKKWSSLAQSLTGFTQAMVSVLIVIWGVYLVNEGRVNMGALVAAMMLSGRVLAPLASVAGALTRLRQTMHSYHMLDQLMKIPTERTLGKTYVNRAVAGGGVELEDVSFSYPDAETEALKNISLNIRQGEKVGLIGRVGAGKSTLGRLLCGLYYPSGGSVLIDGIDTRQFDPADLRNGVGFLSQENVLFSGTLRENIAMGQLHASNDDILHAARLAGVEDFVNAHPRGYDMPVGEGGRLLSGGQKQSVALARILLRRPQVLFLDEPSSHLDMAAEERLLQRLAEFNSAGMTIFISTHRLSLLKLTDRLIALDGGRVVADGPRDQVLADLQRKGAERSKQHERAEL